jgi:hypothetical protein
MSPRMIEEQMENCYEEAIHHWFPSYALEKRFLAPILAF